ncbi:MAG: hypothetical protein WKF84_17115 [Pyrinomonadaceae bacterium]
MQQFIVDIDFGAVARELCDIEDAPGHEVIAIGGEITREVGRSKSSSAERNTEGQTTSPVLAFTSCEPSMPGMIITGRLPSRMCAAEKMRSRLGVRSQAAANAGEGQEGDEEKDADLQTNT